MQIRIASPEDLEFIEGAYEHARAFMQENGNATQWPEGYPGRIDAEEDIARRHCFLVADDEGRVAHNRTKEFLFCNLFDVRKAQFGE